MLVHLGVLIDYIFTKDLKTLALQDKLLTTESIDLKLWKLLKEISLINPQNAYTSEYQRKLKQQKNRNENKERKRLYDQQRNKFKYSWGETSNEELTLFNISDKVFQ